MNVLILALALLLITTIAVAFFLVRKAYKKHRYNSAGYERSLIFLAFGTTLFGIFSTLALWILATALVCKSGESGISCAWFEVPLAIPLFFAIGVQSFIAIWIKSGGE